MGLRFVPKLQCGNMTKTLQRYLALRKGTTGSGEERSSARALTAFDRSDSTGRRSIQGRVPTLERGNDQSGVSPTVKMLKKDKILFKLGKRKQAFLRDFSHRHALRWHMSIILIATGLSGILASKLFLSIGVHNFIIRYPTSILIAYGVFFLFVKLWLFHVSPGKKRTNPLDWLDVPTFDGSILGKNTSILGGGGQSGGAGASDSFDLPATFLSESSLSTGSAASCSALDRVGEIAGDALGEDGGVIGLAAIAILALLVTGIVGSAVYLIFQAPIILSEAAFEGLLVVSLVKKSQSIGDEDWMGSLFQTTWVPFAVTLLVGLIAASFLHYFYPEAIKLADVINK